MKHVSIVFAIAVLLAGAGAVTASTCSDILEKAPADAKPLFKLLPNCAAVGDMQSACLLLKAGKNVTDKNK